MATLFSRANRTFIPLALLGATGMASIAHAQNVAQLEERIRKLEALISAREGGGALLRAPITIVDAKGNAIVEVTRYGDKDSIILGPESPNRVVLLRGGGNASVAVANPQKIASMSSSSDGASVTVTNQNVASRMGAGHSNEQGFFVGESQAAAQSGSTPKPAAVYAELAARAGETAILRLRDMQGQTVVAAGSNKARGGVGQVGINAPQQKIGLLLTTGAAGDGEVSLYSAAAGKEAIRLDGQKHSFQVFNRAGTTAASVGLGQDGSGSGGNFTSYGAIGGVFSAGTMSNGYGAACAVHPKRGNVCLF